MMEIAHSPDPSAIRRALSDSLRLRIYETLQARPRTARELAQALGHKANRLYYHLRILEEAGLIGEAGRDVSGRMVERIFKANGLPGDTRPIGQGDPEDRSVFFGSLLEATRSELVETVVAQSQGLERNLRVSRSTLRTTPAGFADMVRGIARLRDEALKSAGEPDAADYRLAYALYEVDAGRTE